MAAAIVNRRDLDVDAIPASIRQFVLDAQVREVDLLVEVRQLVLQRPLLDLSVVTIWPAVRVVATPILGGLHREYWLESRAG